MWEKLKRVHYMFHIALVFIIFPVAGAISEMCIRDRCYTKEVIADLAQLVEQRTRNA